MLWALELLLGPQGKGRIFRKPNFSLVKRFRSEGDQLFPIGRGGDAASAAPKCYPEELAALLRGKETDPTLFPSTWEPFWGSAKGRTISSLISKLI